jgi:SEC-C motif-containing protein
MTGTLMPDILCPCQSGISYAECCQPYLLRNNKPQTPEILMRSRYTAYDQRDAHYLVDTWLNEAIKDRQQLLSALEADFEHCRWIGLKIIEANPPLSNETTGYVEFMAYYFDEKQQTRQVIFERSRFVLIEQQWFYVDGIKPKVDRNALCPCGSNKKYKKCCY